MKLISQLSLIILVTFSFSAFALEQSSSVKVTQLIKTTESWNNKPIVYPQGKPEITGLLVEIAPGGQTGWHLHPVPSFGMIIEGTLEVRLKNGKSKRFTAGQALTEVINTLHNGHNIGKTPLKLVVFYAGVKDQPLTIKHP
jgi:quercetin dioxygenase-like cupin family protein